MSVDYNVVVGVDAAKSIDILKSVATALKSAGLGPTKFNAAEVNPAYYGSDELDTVITISGDSAEVNALNEMVAAGKISVSLGKRDTLPLFLRGQSITATASARRLQPADLLHVQTSAVGVLPEAVVGETVTWLGDDKSDGFRARFIAFPHNNHDESTDGGIVKATVASLTAEQHVRIVRQPSARVVAVHTNIDGWVWPDDPSITAVLQPTDAVRSHVLESTTLCLKARYLGFASEEAVGK